MKTKLSGFTLIELLVVMAIIATLLTIALPRYFSSVDKAQEQVLRHNLNTMREAIDKYYSDKGHYPPQLNSLVEEKYIHSLPIDPISESNQTWIIVPSKSSMESGVAGVNSGAIGKGSNGIPFSEW